MDAVLGAMQGLPDGWAIAATGGYANGSLCPGSDIDIVLLHPAKEPGAQAMEVRATSAEAPTTFAELRALEKRVVAAALERSGGKISGKGGAAELLGVPPTTLGSKVRALGLAKRKRAK